ncbi:MAG TPA: hypothetical protein VMU87_04450 [Stellaceae bacterium]|nr:hypothetical protein [Stellaceae bacterium]
MGQGLYYLLTIIAIGVVMRWYIRNDGIGPGDRTTGILSMDRPRSDETQKSARRGGAR